MGAIDTEAKAYFSSPDKVADAFNYFMYGGKNIIKPNELNPMDTTSVVLPYGNGKKQPLQKIRDVLKLYTAMKGNDAYYLILGIELQSHTHFAMPVRNMLYDAMNYAQQINDIAKAHKEAGDELSEDEFLSGITVNDSLMPVITLVINLSHEPWEGATSLHEMLSVKDKNILSFVPDYKINLLTPSDIDDKDFDKFRTELGTVMQFVKHKGDDNREWMRGNKRFEEMNRETAELVKTITGAKIKFTEKGEVVNMWVAYENDINQAEQNGERRGENNMITAIRMMKENKPFAEIGEKTGIPEQRLNELKAVL